MALEADAHNEINSVLSLFFFCLFVCFLFLSLFCCFPLQVLFDVSVFLCYLGHTHPIATLSVSLIYVLKIRMHV